MPDDLPWRWTDITSDGREQKIEELVKAVRPLHSLVTDSSAVRYLYVDAQRVRVTIHVNKKKQHRVTSTMLRATQRQILYPMIVGLLNMSYSISVAQSGFNDLPRPSLAKGATKVIAGSWRSAETEASHVSVPLFLSACNGLEHITYRPFSTKINAKQ